MGQDAHKKYCEFKEKEKLANRYKNSEEKHKDAYIAKLEWQDQEREDKDDFDRGYKLLSDNEY